MLTALCGLLVKRNPIGYTEGHDSQLQTHGVGTIFPPRVKRRDYGRTRQATQVDLGPSARFDLAARHGVARTLSA